MPAKSRAQQRLMQAAEHGANFPMARKIRASMTHQQMHDFAVGSEKGKPQHVKLRKKVAKAAAKSSYSESHAYNFRSRNNLKRGAAY